MAELSITESLKKYQRNILLSSVLIIFGVGTVFYHFVERWSWLNSLYFCVVTTATVGYGDLTPTKPISKIFTIFYIIVGITIVLGALNYLMRQRAEKFQSKVDSKFQDKLESKK
jgi:hypothetical protein